MPSSELIETKFFIFLIMSYHGFRTWWISWPLHLENLRREQTTHRSSCSHIFSKIGVLRNFTNIIGKHLCCSRFLIKLQALHDYNTGVSCEICEIFKKHLILQSTSGGCFLTQLLLHMKMYFSESPHEAKRNWAVFFRLINWLTFIIYKYIEIIHSNP